MIRLFAIAFSWMAATLAFGATPPDLLFQSNEVLDITLRGPFDRIDRERNKDNEYEGSLSYIDVNGTEVVLDLSYQVRGNWRLDRRNCNYPPLWIDLRRGQTPGTIFENQNRLKLVVQCSRQDRYADYLHKELRLYQAFTELTEYNFDTRLLNVTYVDVEDEDATRTQAAFFIEHQKRLADRFGFDEVDVPKISNLDLNRLQSTLVTLFMYFIGNTDYSIIEGPPGDECCHNAKLLLDEAGEYYPIPYDFDASGYVDSSYAPDPNPSLNLRSNRSRLYRGFCVDEEVMSAAVDRYQQAKPRIMEIVSDQTHVSRRATNRNIRYLEDFYETLDNPRNFERSIVRRCRG